MSISVDASCRLAVFVALALARPSSFFASFRSRYQGITLSILALLLRFFRVICLDQTQSLSYLLSVRIMLQQADVLLSYSFVAFILLFWSYLELCRVLSLDLSKSLPCVIKYVLSFDLCARLTLVLS